MLDTDRLSHVTVAILAGGLGTRLRTVVADRPKVLAEVNGRPFLLYLLDQVADAGARAVILCTGYLGEQIEHLVGSSYRDLDVQYSPEPEPLGTGGALRLAAECIETDAVLVMNGDSYFQTDLCRFWRWHQLREANASLMLTWVLESQRYGQVQLRGDGAVLRFFEKNRSSGAGLINAGIYLIHRGFLRTIPEGRMVSLEKEVFPDWVRQEKLLGYPGWGNFLDIGTPESYAQADSFFTSIYRPERSHISYQPDWQV